MENLRRSLQSKDPEKASYFGFQLKVKAPLKNGYFNGGPGQKLLQKI